MRRAFGRTIVCGVVLALGYAAQASAQPETYYLHREASSSSGRLQLKTASVEGPVLTLQSAELKNKPTGLYVVKEFDTQAGVPNITGVIPSGSTVSWVLYMRKTANVGTLKPHVRVRLNSLSGTLLCAATNATGGPNGNGTLTTTLASFPYSCTTSAAVTLTATDRLWFWVGVNITGVPGNNNLKGELQVEAAAVPSSLAVPLPPAISSLTPSSGSIGQAVTVGGSRFGATQGTSTVTFNGTQATPTSWSSTSIGAPVPAGATTGPVVVTVNGAASNGSTFTVQTQGIGGTITRTSDATPISGASVQAFLAGVLKGSATSAANGTYTVGNLDAGAYDVRVSASGFSTELVQNVAVTLGATTTVNVGLSVPGGVSGVVTESNGTTPIAGAAVTVYQGPFQKGTTNTNATGNYAIASLHPGTYTVQASSVGYQTKEQSAVVTENTTTTTSNVSLNAAPSGSVIYAYDVLGRLVQVTDPSGESAFYRYDAVGNIIAIDRVGTGSVGISGFSPTSGAVGVSVTISGTGFSATAGQNTVTFNGTAAPVVSASTTQLVVTVPVSATTGTIGVTTPSGSASSTTPFAVLASSGAPTVTSFSPSIGVPGDAIAITGANFETVLANSRITLNTRAAFASSGTTTTLQAAVPTYSMGGRVSVATPLGSATSTQDFFVPPSPHVVADVVATGRMSLGVTDGLTIGTGGKVGLMLFDGTATERVSAAASSTFAGCWDLSIYNPNATLLTTSFSCNPGSFLDAQTLAASGTYTLYVKPVNTGNLTVTLYAVTDVTGTIPTDGTGVVEPLSTPGQNARLTFSGTAGQRVSATASGSLTGGQPNDNGCWWLSVVKPDGTTLGSTFSCNPSTFLAPLTLPVTGTYTLLSDPSTSNTGTLTVKLYAFSDITGTIATDGTPVVEPLSAPGQIAELTFAGTSGQRISASATSSLNGNACWTFSIRKPDATTLASAFSCDNSPAFIDVQTLPVTGTYTLVSDPMDAVTGTVTVKVHTVTDVTGSITPNGAGVPVTIATPGQRALLTFSGSASQVISVAASGSTVPGCIAFNLIVLKPDGSTLTSGGFCGASGSLTNITLPSAGTYTLIFDPGAGNTGSATLTVTSP